MDSWLEFLSYWGRGIVEEGPTWTQHGLHIRSEIECESRIELLNRKLFKMYQNSNMNIMRLFRCCSSYENLCACRRAAISYCRWDEIAPEQKKKKTTISKHLIMLFSELSSNKNNKKQHSHSIIYICIYHMMSYCCNFINTLSRIDNNDSDSALYVRYCHAHDGK